MKHGRQSVLHAARSTHRCSFALIHRMHRHHGRQRDLVPLLGHRPGLSPHRHAYAAARVLGDLRLCRRGCVDQPARRCRWERSSSSLRTHPAHLERVHFEDRDAGGRGAVQHRRLAGAARHALHVGGACEEGRWAREPGRQRCCWSLPAGRTDLLQSPASPEFNASARRTHARVAAQVRQLHLRAAGRCCHAAAAAAAVGR